MINNRKLRNRGIEEHEQTQLLCLGTVTKTKIRTDKQVFKGNKTNGRKLERSRGRM